MMIKLCCITTKAMTMKSFGMNNLKHLANNGYRIIVICESNNSIKKTCDELGFKYVPINARGGNVGLIEVIRCIYAMVIIFRNEKLDIIQYASSNAGLYASVAGFLAKVPVRIFCQWGIMYMNTSGIRRIIYKNIEKITCNLSTVIESDSKSIQEYAIRENLYSKNKSQIVCRGSASGVDLKYYDFGIKSVWKEEILNRHSIPRGSFVFGYVGRIVRDKGIHELLEAFLSINCEDAYLLMVGAIDETMKSDKKFRVNVSKTNRIRLVEFTEEVNKYYSAFEFLILPSYREGLPMVILEAAALKVPSIITNIPGPTDFVMDGINGLICEKKSVSSLESAMIRAKIMTQEQYKTISENAYEIVNNEYSNTIYREALLNNRNMLIKI